MTSRAIAPLVLLLAALGLSFVEVQDGTSSVGFVRAAVGVITLAFVPGLLLIRLLAPGTFGPLTCAALSLALSPIVTGTVMTLLLFVGMPAIVAARLLLLLLLGGLVYVGWRDRSRHESRHDEPIRSLRGAGTALASVIVTAAVLWPLLTSDRVRVSIHGLLHSALLYSATERGLPPENPFFAGEPVRYYWTWHVATAGATSVADIDPVLAFAAGNTAALLAFLFLLGCLGRELFPGRGATLLSMLLGFLCLNPIGGFLFPGAEAPGTLQDVAAGANPINVLYRLAVGGEVRITATLTKFLNVSSFPQAFCLLIAAVLLLVRLAKQPSWALSLVTMTALMGCISLSPITGATAGLAIGAAAILLVPLARPGEAGRRGLSAVIAALVASLVLALPFVLLGTAGKSGIEPAVQLLPTLDKLQRVLLNLGPAMLLALPACVALWGREGTAGTAGRLLVLSAFLVAALGVLLAFPVRSEYKMVRMAAPLFGVLAAGTVVLATRTRRAWITVVAGALVLAPFIPTNVIAWDTYRAHARAPMPLSAVGSRLVIDPQVHQDARIYEWIRINTPEDTIIVTDPSRKDLAVGGPEQGDEIPALAHRPIFTDVIFYMTDYEPELALRLGIVSKVYSCRSPKSTRCWRCSVRWWSWSGRET